LTTFFPIHKSPVTSLGEVSVGFGGAECGVEALSARVAGFSVWVGLDMVRGQVRIKSTEIDYARTSEPYTRCEKNAASRTSLTWTRSWGMFHAAMMDSHARRGERLGVFRVVSI
jgi:hypothetical protein